MSSWICGKNVSAQFCNHPDACNWGNGTAAVGSSFTPDVKWDNQASRLILDSYDPIRGNGAALLWTEWDCKGTSTPIFSAEPGKSMYYTDYDLWFRNYRADWTSSVMVPIGYELSLWDWDGFQGDRVMRYGAVNSDGNMSC